MRENLSSVGYSEDDDILSKVRMIDLQEFLTAFLVMMKDVVQKIGTGMWSFVTPPEKAGGRAKSNHWLVAEYINRSERQPYAVISYDMKESLRSILRDGVTHLVYVDDAWYTGLQLSDSVREILAACSACQ